MATAQTFSIHALELGPMENFIYLIHDHATNRAAVVDPAWDVPQVLRLAGKQGVRITDILLTHSHHDHINGISDVLDKYDAQLHLMKDEAQFWGQALDMPTLHHGGDVIALGETQIKTLLTPGHTPGSACYHVGNELITGDTLFVTRCGRADLRNGDPAALYHSLLRLAAYPPETKVYPGHDYGPKPNSTIAFEREHNDFIKCPDLESFIRLRMG